MTDLLYYMLYCAAGDDETKSKHGMVVYGMEIISTQLSTSLSMILFGVFNVKFNSFILYVLILLPIPFFLYYIINRYYIKSGRYNQILERYATTTNRQKLIYKIITIFLFVISFALLFVGGITMSYLFSLHNISNLAPRL